MVLPAPRFRTTRKWAANNVQPDNSLVVEGAATTNVNLTVGAGAAIIVFAAGNVTSAARVDGVAMTLVGKTSNGAMYGITGLAAGARNVQVDRSGSSAHIVAVLSYTGVSTITGGALGSGSGNTPSGTPSGSGHLAVVGFDFGVSSGDVGSVVSNGNLRQLYRRTAANALAVADKDTVPVTITNPTGGSWTSIGVWLST
ncbi:minor tail protein [Gordonia phage Bosnia]|uniref:Minor tail protein n=1 Tax=Gordonia phage Bosnia TaxID=2776839 RepID=A0A7L8ZD90_9CAUD|nr:minor tail protein [Gordonia phage Bosnia]QOI66859.1 minor tail protein [Gordonia phage Bosnia]